MLKFCSRPGCGEFVPVGTRFCERHQAATWRELDETRGNASKRGYDGAWRRFRRRFLSQYPLCLDCERQGRIVGATEVHHIEKVRDNPARRLDSSNVIGLCRSCHTKRTMKGE